MVFRFFSCMGVFVVSDYEYGYLLLASAYTPVHAGSGRGYGFVDLPVQRDSLGYPEVWGSSVKGALKGFLLRSVGVEAKGFFGSEPEESPTVPGLAVVTGLSLLAVPVPSVRRGIVYVTTPYLASRVAGYVDVVKRLRGFEGVESLTFPLEAFEKALVEVVEAGSSLGEGEAAASKGVAVDGAVYVSGSRVRVSRELEFPGGLDDALRSLNVLYSYKKVFENLVVLPDGVGRSVVNGALQVVYRNRLSDATKTVERGALWSEEYLPYGSLLVGAVMVKDFEKLRGLLEAGRYEAQLRLYESAWGKLSSILGAMNGYLVVGGKETVGKGVLRVAIARG